MKTSPVFRRSWNCTTAEGIPRDRRCNRQVSARSQSISVLRDSYPPNRVGSGFLEHRFVRVDRVIGVVAVRGVFKGPSGPVDPEVLLAGLGHTEPTPELPEWAKRSSGWGVIERAAAR